MTCQIHAICPHCKETFDAVYYLQIDVVAFPELKESLITHQLNKQKCPHCGQYWRLIAPCVYWEKDWICVVLENLVNPPQLAKDAMLEINNLLRQTKPERTPLPSQTFIMGTMDELVYVLENPSTRGYTKPLSEMLFRNWGEAPEILIAISDAFLQADMPEYSFWVLGETLAYIPELYFQSRISETLDLTAIAAGDRLLPGQLNQKTASEQLELIQRVACELEQEFHADISPFENFEYIYIKPLPDPKIHSEVGLSPEMSIYQTEASIAEKALAWMFVILWTSVARQNLPAANHEVNFFSQLITEKFCMHWPDLSSEEQMELDKLFMSLTGSYISEVMQLRRRYSWQI